MISHSRDFAPCCPDRRRPVDEFGLAEAVDRLGQGVVLAVSDRSDGGRRTDLGETLAVTHRGELRVGIGVTSQAGQRDSA